MVWRVDGAIRAMRPALSDALRVAVGASRVVPTLYDELKKRAIADRADRRLSGIACALTWFRRDLQLDARSPVNLPSHCQELALAFGQIRV